MAAMVKAKGSDELLKIGEVARRTDGSLRTIRYYQSLGLIAIRAVLKGGGRWRGIPGGPRRRARWPTPSSMN
jgi:hypothetical protein